MKVKAGQPVTFTRIPEHYEQDLERPSLVYIAIKDFDTEEETRKYMNSKGFSPAKFDRFRNYLVGHGLIRYGYAAEIYESTFYSDVHSYLVTKEKE